MEPDNVVVVDVVVVVVAIVAAAGGAAKDVALVGDAVRVVDVAVGADASVRLGNHPEHLLPTTVDAASSLRRGPRRWSSRQSSPMTRRRSISNRSTPLRSGGSRSRYFPCRHRD